MAKNLSTTRHVTPELLRGLMHAKGIKNTLTLAKMAGVAPPTLYLFLSGRSKTLAVCTRRKLAAVFVESQHLFVADILGEQKEPQAVATPEAHGGDAEAGLTNLSSSSTDRRQP